MAKCLFKVSSVIISQNNWELKEVFKSVIIKANTVKLKNFLIPFVKITIINSKKLIIPLSIMNEGSNPPPIVASFIPGIIVGKKIAEKSVPLPNKV